MIQVNNIEPKDDALRKPEFPKPKEVNPIAEDSKPSAPDTQLNISDLKNEAKRVFLENFAGILKLAITGSPLRLIVISVVLVLAILFGLKIL